MTLTLTGKNLAIFCDSLFKRDSEESFYEAFNDLVEERPEVSTEDSILKAKWMGGGNKNNE